ncbi:MAG: hypothetical protein H7Z40_03530 [Phycisphaerae bacterium]|nr:hypothetical protein [Gemmatimonadaceae bacterium]
MIRSNALRQRCLATAIAVGGMLVSVPALLAQGSMGKDDMGKMDKMSQPMMDKMMSGWPMASKEAVMFMSKKYGPPAAMTSGMAIWGKTGPWKRTIVFGQEYAHDFPAPHTDVMQQWVDYKAPASMYDELAMYDGSVVLERTTGEISARCDKEAANFLALNLAHDIVTGKQTVDGARMMYGEQIMKMKAMQSAPYTEKLMFGMMNNTGDKDKPHMK